MSVEVACTCDEAFGLPHSHLYRRLNVPVPNAPLVTYECTGWVRLWVDWKAVARGVTPDREHRR